MYENGYYRNHSTKLWCVKDVWRLWQAKTSGRFEPESLCNTVLDSIFRQVLSFVFLFFQKQYEKTLCNYHFLFSFAICVSFFFPAVHEKAEDSFYIIYERFVKLDLFLKG
jgi:hypothetical protein